MKLIGVKIVFQLSNYCSRKMLWKVVLHNILFQKESILGDEDREIERDTDHEAAEH